MTDSTKNNTDKPKIYDNIPKSAIPANICCGFTTWPVQNVM
ncbi:hypothetical protein VCRA2114E365_150061 [Vibrio crassostreae]|nr:hypothetical protein VCRA2115O371_130059 [Vibrio crassostreae]CAK1761482.1 hypothetical protein VCRA2113O351_140062 [Vibrio crassostreae]CAK1765637.1 hypothetical protein VCRA2117O376_140060 [Vibrio crassostreae]CAK1765920.1 hypothetical protein VCRA2114O369_140059 [Vibrio crassostreae]CAK1766579.1 hypothetical protein VCRA2113O362_140060 [Vibrio crassostreae]